MVLQSHMILETPHTFITENLNLLIKKKNSQKKKKNDMLTRRLQGEFFFWLRQNNE